MANDIITNLHPDNDPNTNLYPNIKKENIPNKAIDYNRLDVDVRTLINSIVSLSPQVDVSTNILAFKENKGIYVGSDTGEWYYWNGTQYVSGGIYHSSEDVMQIKKDLDNVYTFCKSRNLVNADVYEVGALQENGTIATNGSWANYRTTDFIALEQNQDYIFSNFYNMVAIVRRRIILLYDKERKFVAGSYINTTDNASATFNSGENYYARLSYENIVLPMLEVGTETTDYVPFSEKYQIIAKLGENPVNQVNNLINPQSIYNITKKSKNLIAPDGITATLIYNDTGTTVSNENYSTCDFIPLEAGQSITFSPNVRKFIAYTLNKVVIDGTYVDTLTSNYTYTATEDCYVRASTQNIYLDEWQAEYGEKATDYENYGKYLTIPLGDKPKEQVVKIVDARLIEKTDRLAGKKWYACGDSFTAQGYTSSDPGYGTDSVLPSGKYQGKNAVYPYYIGNRTNCNVQNVAEGGMTLATYTGGTNCFTYNNQYQTLIGEDADIITLYFGINDGHHNVPIGTINDNTTDTFYGALNVVISWILENRPNAKLGIIISNGCDTTDYPIATINACKKWGIPYLDINGDETLPMVIRTNMRTNLSNDAYNYWLQRYRVSATNTHPNYKAHEDESYMIQQFLERL